MRRALGTLLAVLIMSVTMTGCEGRDESLRLGGAKATGFYVYEILDCYERSLVTAINEGDFSEVEYTLLPGSNLYEAQKRLVADLHKKGIKEKLIDYEIADEFVGEPGPEGDTFHVVERIGIRYPGKEGYEEHSYRWAYAIVSVDGRLFLSDIAKWDGK